LDFISQLGKNIALDPNIVTRVNGIYKFVIDGKSWIVDLKNPPGSVKEGDGTADCTITMKSDDFIDMMSGKLDGQSAFVQGKLKVQGNIGLALKLNQLRGAPKPKL
jgi:putative sterol carrier protein